MNEITASTGGKQNMLLRALYMLFMLFILNVCGTVLGIVTIIQFVIVLLKGGPNDRLVALGRNLSSYLRQIVLFLTYASEEVPFPFSEWPVD